MSSRLAQSRSVFEGVGDRVLNALEMDHEEVASMTAFSFASGKIVKLVADKVGLQEPIRDFAVTAASFGGALLFQELNAVAKLITPQNTTHPTELDRSL